MDPTALPTDNLYKFLALAGMGVTGFCVWFWWTRSRQLANDRHSLRVFRAEQRDKIERIRRRAAAFKDRFEEKVSRLDELEKKVAVHADEERRLAEAADALAEGIDEELDTEHAKDVDALDDVTDVTRKIESERSRIRDDEKRFDWLSKGLLGGAVVGLLMAVSGFVLWHIRLQRYLDEATELGVREQKAKADLAELELRRARAKP